MVIGFSPLYFRQNLRPGVYRDLKVEKPIGLDSGSYTFINLQMKNLGKGVWLDWVRNCESRTAEIPDDGKVFQNQE